jgi:phosphoribosyl 1,2-cyclic phosphodiesterase
MKSSMTARFWGVRGSIPSPGVTTVRYGGNTPCVSLHLPEGRLLIFDAGTGIRELGKALIASTEQIFILLSHAHWDHIQGFPFFAPIYQASREISMFPTFFGGTTVCGMCQKLKAEGARGMTCPLLAQMDGAHFPVKSEQVPSQTKCVTEREMEFLRSRGVNITTIAANHPGGSFGYRVENDGRSFIYLTDNELEPPYPKTTSFDGFVKFCWQADVLIHDAQYLQPDMPQKHGWGHSLIEQVCDLALKAEVKHLVLYHHDPDRTDEELDRIQEHTRRRLAEQSPLISCTVAFEGLSLDI